MPGPIASTRAWGIWHRQGEPEGFDEVDEIADLVRLDQAGTIQYGWSPSSEYVQPIEHIVPDAVLQRLALQRQRTLATESLAFIGSCAIIIAAIVMLVVDYQLDRSLLFILIFFLFQILQLGLNDFPVHRFEALLHTRNPELLLKRHSLRKYYATWTGSFTQLGTLVLGGSLVVVYLLQMLVGMAVSINAAGLVKNAVSDDPFRLLSCGFLHGSLVHIFFNALTAVVLGMPVKVLLGTGRLFLAFTVAVVAGSLASWWWSPVSSVGASGGILGFAGVLIGLALRRPELRAVGMLGPQLRWIGMIAIIGLLGVGMIDNAAHLGGFIGGLIMGLILAPTSPRWPAAADRPSRDPIALLGYAVFVVSLCWTATRLLMA